MNELSQMNEFRPTENENLDTQEGREKFNTRAVEALAQMNNMAAISRVMGLVLFAENSPTEQDILAWGTPAVGEKATRRALISLLNQGNIEQTPDGHFIAERNISEASHARLNSEEGDEGLEYNKELVDHFINKKKSEE